MGEIQKQEISAVSEDIKQAIARKSAASLPVNPTEKGFKPQDIINMLYKPIIDTANSAISEIDRVVKEANVALTQIISDTNNEFETRDNSNTEFKEEYDKTVEALKKSIAKMGINDMKCIGSDENGGNIYRFYAHDSNWYGDITAPKGEAGDGVASVTYEGTDGQGGNVYKQLYTSGKAVTFTAPRGEPGTGFRISKAYSSISEMENGYYSDEVPLYGFVIIDTGSVEDDDNAKLYYKGENEYLYLTDLSGSQGIKGEPGKDGKNGQNGADGYTPQKGTDYFTIVDKLEFINTLYPVGTVYVSTQNFSPAVWGCGTWERIKDRFLLAAGDTYEAGSSGGEADAILVKHSHDHIYYSTSQREVGWKNASGGTTAGGMGVEDTPGDDSVYNLRTSTVGEDGIGKNMPPYLTVYVWKRIA